jgi:hypothetical protein
MGHQPAGRDVADQAELAPPFDDQHADPQDGDVALAVPPLGRRRNLVGKGEARLQDLVFRQHVLPRKIPLDRGADFAPKDI